MPTSINRNSKPDTVLLCLPEGGGSAALTDDVSQLRTDLSDNVDYVFEDPSERAAITYPREISLVLDLDSGDVGTLIKHGANALDTHYTYRIAVNGGTVTCAENGIARVSGALPGVGASAEKFLIHWSTRAEGASVRSELFMANLTDGSVAYFAATHAAGTTNVAWSLWIGGDDFDVGPGDLSRYYAVRIGRRFHSTSEAREDWITERTPPSIDQIRREGILVPDRATLDIAEDGSFAGPAYLWSGHAFQHNDRRLVGALVNARFPDPAHITHDYEPEEFWRAAPGDKKVHLYRGLSWYRPVPGKVSRAQVRIFIRQTIEIGTDTAEVRYRCYSIDNLPVNGKAPPMKYYRTGEATCDTSHGTGLGQWSDLGVLSLAVNADGYTWLCIGVEFDEDSPLVGDTNAYVAGVVIEPYYEESGGGDLDILAP